MTAAKRAFLPRPEQLTLDGICQIPPAPRPSPGSLDLDTELCGVLSGAIRRSERSRTDIAATMSELTGRTISVHMLNAWTAEGRPQYCFPLRYACAFEVATDCADLQLLMARHRGSLVLTGRDAIAAQLGQVKRRQRELRRLENRLERELDFAS